MEYRIPSTPTQQTKRLRGNQGGKLRSSHPKQPSCANHSSQRKRSSKQCGIAGVPTAIVILYNLFPFKDVYKSGILMNTTHMRKIVCSTGKYRLPFAPPCTWLLRSSFAHFWKAEERLVQTSFFILSDINLLKSRLHNLRS